MNPKQQQTEYTDCVQYILLRGERGGATGSHHLWSCPVRLPLQSPALQSVSVPIGSEEDALVSVISQIQNGMTYLVLKEEQPQVVIHNECDFHIHFAEAIKETSPVGWYYTETSNSFGVESYIRSLKELFSEIYRYLKNSLFFCPLEFDL